MPKPKPIRATRYNMNKLLGLRALAAGGVMFGRVPCIQGADGLITLRKDVLAEFWSETYVQYNSTLLPAGASYGGAPLCNPTLIKWYTINVKGRNELARLEAAIGHWWPVHG